MNLYKLLFYPLLVIMLCSCSKRNNDHLNKFFNQDSEVHYLKNNEKTKRIELVANFEIEEKIEIFYNQISKITIDSYGRIFLENNKGVHVYEENGTFLTTIGQKGRGHGEFQAIHNLKIRNDSLYVYDASLRRISVFDINSFSLVNEIGVPSTKGFIGLGEFDVLENGSFVIGLRGTRKQKNSLITENFVEYYFMARNGMLERSSFYTSELADDFVITNNKGTSYPPIPFDRTTLFDVSNTDRIYFAWTGEIAIRSFNSNGEDGDGFYYSFENVRITSDNDFPEFHKVLGFVSETKRLLGNRLPKTLPAVAHFFIDDEERIWLATIVSDKKIYDWWVLGKKGEQIAKLILPKDQIIRSVKNNTVYISTNTSESKVATVKSYKIKWDSISTHRK